MYLGGNCLALFLFSRPTELLCNQMKNQALVLRLLLREFMGHSLGACGLYAGKLHSVLQMIAVVDSISDLCITF